MALRQKDRQKRHLRPVLGTYQADKSQHRGWSIAHGSSIARHSKQRKLRPKPRDRHQTSRDKHRLQREAPNYGRKRS
jgi:hypothetical protein